MKKYLLLCLFLISFTILPQFQLQWTSAGFSYSNLSGWMSFEKQGNTWLKRLYTLDSTRFDVMQSGYSSTPQYSYSFNAAEILAGAQMYSLSADLNGNGYSDFYILGWYGTTTSYRQSFKVYDIVTNSVIFEKNDANYFYNYPTFSDVNNDGLLECIVVKYDYPSFLNFYYEVYSTGITGVNDKPIEYGFKLMQNYPNPFNPETVIDFNLSEQAPVKLEIFDVNGSKVKTLINKEMSLGSQTVKWDGSNDMGTRVPTGVYMYTLTTGNKSLTKKMIILK